MGVVLGFEKIPSGLHYTIIIIRIDQNVSTFYNSQRALRRSESIFVGENPMLSCLFYIPVDGREIDVSNNHICPVQLHVGDVGNLITLGRVWKFGQGER